MSNMDLPPLSSDEGDEDSADSDADTTSQSGQAQLQDEPSQQNDGNPTICGKGSTKPNLLTLPPLSDPPTLPVHDVQEADTELVDLTATSNLQQTHGLQPLQQSAGNPQQPRLREPDSQCFQSLGLS